MQGIENEHTTHPHSIEKASPDDIEELKQLLLRANEYSLQLSDVPTWKNIPGSLDAVEHQLTQGNTYVIREDTGAITSSISLSEKNEPWWDVQGDKDALYFTKLMKHPEKAQPKEAEQLLAFAAEEAKKRKKTFLRCDVAGEQEGMITYYEKFGFQKKGDFFYPSNKRPGTLLEIPVAQLLQNTHR